MTIYIVILSQSVECYHIEYEKLNPNYRWLCRFYQVGKVRQLIQTESQTVETDNFEIAIALAHKCSRPIHCRMFILLFLVLVPSSLGLAPDKKIIGGEEVDIGDHPWWMVQLLSLYF